MKAFKSFISILILLLLITGCSRESSTDVPDPGPVQPEGDEISAEFEKYGDYGRVLKAVPGENQVYIEAEGYYGYHIEDDPSMTVGVTISSEGKILSVVNIASKDQTPGFAEMVTDDYLKEAYTDATASPNLETAPVTGATISSKAVMYAVQTAAYYAENVYGYVADVSSAEIEELNQVFPADYKEITTDYKVDEKTIGTVLFAAEGRSDEGNVVGLKVRSANKMNYEGTARTGWDSAEPNLFTMIIIINKDSNKVVAWKMVNDGTKRPEYFTVPEEKINSYMNVEITGQDVFDNFTEGLVYNLEVELEEDSEGNNVIAGTSVVYTGASESGTFSSQHVRQCFRTAAYFYANY